MRDNRHVARPGCVFSRMRSLPKTTSSSSGDLRRPNRRGLASMFFPGAAQCSGVHRGRFDGRRAPACSRLKNGCTSSVSVKHFFNASKSSAALVRIFWAMSRWEQIASMAPIALDSPRRPNRSFGAPQVGYASGSSGGQEPREHIACDSLGALAPPWSNAGPNGEFDRGFEGRGGEGAIKSAPFGQRRPSGEPTPHCIPAHADRPCAENPVAVVCLPHRLACHAGGL